MIKITTNALAIIFLGGLLVSSNSMALPVNDDYWTIADLTTGTTDSNISTVDFGLMFESAIFFNSGGSFGFYDIDDPFNTLEVLSLSEGTQNSVYFTENSGQWSAGLDNDLSDQAAFNNVFGFYFNYGGTTYYSDSSLNSGVEFITIDYTPYAGILDFSFNGYTASVYTNDIAPAPVPEPATMLLFGTGIVGLAGFFRKQSTKSVNL